MVQYGAVRDAGFFGSIGRRLSGLAMCDGIVWCSIRQNVYERVMVLYVCSCTELALVEFWTDNQCA